jgi:hypothetical protein
MSTLPLKKENGDMSTESRSMHRQVLRWEAGEIRAFAHFQIMGTVVAVTYQDE